MSILQPCWTEANFLSVVRQDAEDVPDAVFRAVHAPTELQLKETHSGEVSPVAPLEIIERFLERGRDYVQFVVVGKAGTGKSHLIQWLRLNLPHDPKDLVLTIPRAGTSLRGIVEKILDSLEDGESAPFREKLKTAGTQAATPAGRVDKLLNELAWTIRHGAVGDASNDVLKDLLHDLLHDPNLRRKFFGRPNGTVDRLVTHVFIDPRNREDQELRREFTLDDLPLSPEYLDGIGGPARDAIDFIQDEPGMEQRAVDLMTRALDQAIAQTMNFTADDLIALMNTLRTYLARDGRRLILLIEDFARIQGIDTALLQALITPPHQDGERLCELRWAMALTTGYYERLEETVIQRTTFLVDMDATRPVSVAQFASGYLNAVRVGAQSLTESGTNTPNRCDGCMYRERCWEGFGHDGEVGLFPFNAKALEQFASRTASSTDAGFNPRFFLKRVLEPVLLRSYRDFERGTFPPRELLGNVGGCLSPQQLLSLQRADTNTYDRRVTLLELWDGSGRVVNLPSKIHEAFGIPELPDVNRVEAVEDDHAETEEVARPGLRPGIEEPPLIAAIRVWARNEAQLSQVNVNTLRDHVFAALESFIDWDALGVERKQVCQATNPAPGQFGKSRIDFQNQQQREDPEAILRLPLPGRLQETAVALEALIRGNAARGWDTESSGDLAQLANELLLWRDVVTSAISAKLEARQGWDPIVACTELLTLAAFQGRRIKIGDQPEEIIVRLFENATCEASGGVTPEFKNVNERLADAWKPAQEVLRALCAGSKGGVVKTFFLRPAPVLAAIRGLRKRGYRLAEEPPETVLASGRAGISSLPGRIGIVAKAYRDAKSRYPAALDAERTAWGEWATSVSAAIGTDTKLSRFVTGLRAALTDAEGLGFAAGAARLREQLDEFEPRRCDAALDHAGALKDTNDAEAAWRIAMAGLARAQIDGIIASARAFLDRLESKIEAERALMDSTMGTGLQNSKTEIAASLDSLVEVMEVLS